MAHFKNYLNENVRHLPVKSKGLSKKFTGTDFWVLTKRKRKPMDKFEDIFKANFEDLILQVQGGLYLSEILGIYATQKAAMEEFEKYAEIHGRS